MLPDFTPLRRITRPQFANTVHDLFGPDIDPGMDFPLSGDTGRFSVESDANVVTEFGAQAIFDASEFVAAQVSADPARWLSCDPGGVDQACVVATVDALGAKAFRRPLLDAERDVLVGLWTGADADWSVEERLGMLVSALLQSPQFLYLAQGGGTPVDDAATDGSPLVRISDYEMASRLSYMLWDTMPDDALMQAAAAGELHEVEEIEAQVRRMLEDPRAASSIERFHLEWLGVENVANAQKNQEIYTQFDPELAAAMEEQTRRFVRDTVLAGEGSLRELMTSRESEIDGRLAALYGVEAPGLGPDVWGSVELPADRPGLLTQASFLSTYSHEIATSPVERGAYINRKVMCVTLAPPPSNVDTSLPEAPPGATARDVLEAHRADSFCAGCHDHIDPPGLAFENYDAIGAWREIDNGSPIDPAGVLVDADKNELGAFDDAVGLVNLLAEGPDLPNCYVRQWVNYAHGERARDDQECYVASLGADFASGDQSVQELVVHLTTSDAFRFRRDPAADN